MRVSIVCSSSRPWNPESARRRTSLRSTRPWGAGVKHIVFMSTAGARQEEEPALGASYWRGEQHLIATAPTWTILRMNYYAEGLVQQAQNTERGTLNLEP